MKLFNKKEPKFIAAKCPQCQGNLELDANFETAVCQNCSAQCIAENIVKKNVKKETSLDKIITFVERQLYLRRKDRVVKQNKKEEEIKKGKEAIKKYWWVWVLAIVAIFAFIGIMTYLEQI